MNILIATVTAGGGHLQAAAALKEAWTQFRPGDAVKVVDLLDCVSSLFRRVYAEGYMSLISHAPELWGMVFTKTDDPKLVGRLAKIRRGFSRRIYRRFAEELDAFQPDVVFCTHYQPLEILGDYKSKGVSSPPLIVCVVTDFEAHAFWMEPHVDLYCVAAPETKARLEARGALPDKVLATGIPIGRKFSCAVDEAAVRRRLGLRDDLPVLLVLGGGFGHGPIGEILEQLDKVPFTFQTVVVTGKNQEIRKELACLDRAHPTDIKGFVTNMEELMSVASLIITKPGGLTSSEALALGKPVLILSPIPGQEAANSDFLLERGAAAKINRVEDLPFRLEQLLTSAKLAEMAAHARALGRPHAATEICEAAFQRRVGR